MVFQDDSYKDEWLKSKVISKVPLILRSWYLYYNHLFGLRKNKSVFTTEMITSDWSRLFLLVTWQKQELFEGGETSKELWAWSLHWMVITKCRKYCDPYLLREQNKASFDTWGFGFRNRLEVFKCLHFSRNLVILASGSVGWPRSCPTHSNIPEDG